MHRATPSSRRRLLTVLLAVVTAAVTVLVTVLGTSTSAQASGGHSSYIVLAPGDHGSRVATLQRYLHVRPAGGHFGPRTRQAVIRWQAAHHRHRTGLVGKLLWRSATGTATRSSSAPSRSGDRVTGLNWRALAACESGGNPRAVNPSGYYGLYQFSRSTWRSVGGSGLPSRASAAQQTKRAQILFRRAGSSPWPHCGRRLFS